MSETLKWAFEDFIAYAKKTWVNEVGWPTGGGSSAESKLIEIEMAAAEKIKNLLVMRAHELFGSNLPTGYSFCARDKCDGNIIPVTAGSILVKRAEPGERNYRDVLFFNDGLYEFNGETHYAQGLLLSGRNLVSWRDYLDFGHQALEAIETMAKNQIKAGQSSVR